MLAINFNPFPVLETDRLTLRRLTEADVPDVFRLRSDERTMEWIPRVPAKSEEDAWALIDLIDTRIDANEGINWAMELKEEGRVVGIISFHRLMPDHFRAELGYHLMFEYHRRGLMLEAVNALVRYGFEGMGLHSIEAVIAPENAASIGLIEKAGFVKEAHFHENFFSQKRNRFEDSAVYSRVASRQ